MAIEQAVEQEEAPKRAPRKRAARATRAAVDGRPLVKGGDLVVVESPTKARTLERMLGPQYKVEASFGHIRDLPRSKIGIDLETFEPEYVVPDDSEKTVRQLRKDAKAAGRVWLATDLDREGEAIAWHVASVMDVPKDKLRRVTFHEITPAAIQEAFRKPRQIDQDLVNAQQARRVVDRLVGYTMSPLLWKKIRYGLSAGRVQSVALRLIVDREREIKAFVPQEYWSIEAVLANHAGETFTAELLHHKGKKLHVGNEADAHRHLAALSDGVYRVGSIEKRESGRNAAPPFTTSTLQQEASRKLGYSLKRTMVLAQQLYEGIDLGEGAAGLITYMRTDSLHVAEGALRQAHDVIAREFGPQYTLEKPRHYKTRSKGAQEAHEAIRPTDLSRTPDRVRKHLNRDQLRLYTMIWQRMLASQMTPARFESTRLDIACDGYTLRANGRRVLFDGFLRVYVEGTDEPEAEISPLPEVVEGEELKLLGLDPKQHFTQPPPRFTEASLVKTLEEHGIGRPSTYAPTISTLIDRKYVRREGRALVPEDVGGVVVDFLREHFPEVVDTGFTARMEGDLDRIASGEVEWVPMVRDFFTPFSARVEEKTRTIKKSDVTEEKTDRVCPKCGRPVVIKLGRYGRFYSCTGFAKGKKGQPLPPGACDYAEPLEGEKSGPQILEGETCPNCGKPLAVRRGRFGPFIGCTGYPECKYIKKEQQKTGVICPTCGKGELVRRRGRGRSIFFGCERYPECTFTARELPGRPGEAATPPAEPATAAS
ncbi:MAG TPA: type I DNA topoisomerase [Candidatus Limnocylindria bacterium]|nr:type I DNA topoisomerase [Candidatus Limnocylindria bacterium]